MLHCAIEISDLGLTNRRMPVALALDDSLFAIAVRHQVDTVVAPFASATHFVPKVAESRAAPTLEIGRRHQAQIFKTFSCGAALSSRSRAPKPGQNERHRDESDYRYALA